MKKDKYPIFIEKAEKHLVKSIFKEGSFWFDGGDFLMSKYIFKKDDIYRLII